MPRPAQLAQQSFDAQTYVFGYLQTSEALEVSAEVGRTLMPMLGAVVAKAKVTGEMDSAVSEVMGRMDTPALVAGLRMAMEPKTLSSLISRLCSVVTVAGGSGLLQGDAYENHFAGRPGVALQVAVKSFEVNGGRDFFASVGNLAGLLQGAGTTPGPQQ